MTEELTRLAAPRPNRPTPLLGGLTPTEFLQRHWQKRPLLVRGAIPGFTPLVPRRRLFALAARGDVESRLVIRHGRRSWQLRHGPLPRNAFPPVAKPGWTLLIQGADLHDDAVHALLRAFRFVPDARVDDVMISWASEGGGVGAHLDSYDVFLLQAEGRRRWRFGRAADRRLVPGVPLKLLRRFVPEEEHVLEPGDMLYLPPDWAHDGTADGGACMTYSIGFRAPQRSALAAELLQRIVTADADERLYCDPDLAPTRRPAEIPAKLQAFAADAVRRVLAQPHELESALGETLSEPKPSVAFDEPARKWRPGPIKLDRRTRMLYDARHVFINGESYRASGADARLMRKLADERRLDAEAVARASAAARALLREWFEAGWLHRA